MSKVTLGVTFDRPLPDDLSHFDRVLVYLLNGQPFFAGAKPMWRRPIKRGGKWHVRDHGLIPLRGMNFNGVFTA